MKFKKQVVLIFLLLVVYTAFVSGTLTTTLSPASANLCGPYDQIVNLTATNIINNMGGNLTGVGVTLKITPAGLGLSVLTNKTQFLGNLADLSQSQINPSWTVQCNQNFPDDYVLYLEFTGLNNSLGFTTSTMDYARSVITVFSSNDAAPPEIINYSPKTKISTPYTTLEVITDEDATCKYSAISNLNYDDMDHMFNKTGKTTHKEIITNLKDNLYRFYVRCKDSFNNKALSGYEITFEVDTSPTAEINLEYPSPIKAGIIKVFVTTSESVVSSPSLKYSFSTPEKEPVKRSVPLAGSGTSWEGYIVVDKTDSNKIGSFEFSAVDLTGNIGEAITKGNLFLVDATSPSEISLLTAKINVNGHVDLSWSSSEEDIDHFNIYKATEIGTNTPVFATTAEKFFTDMLVDKGEIYYYKVSAVDKAGNEGSLSPEASASFSNEVESTADTIPETPSSEFGGINSIADVNLLQRIDEEISSIENVLDRISEIRTIFGENSGVEVKLFDIIGQLKEAKVELMKLMKNLKDVKENNETMMEEALQNSVESLGLIKNKIPLEIQHGEKQTFEVDFTNGDMLSAVEEFVNKEGKLNSKKEQEKYLATIWKTQQNIIIETEFMPLTLKFLNGEETETVLITKKVSVKEGEIEDAVLLEEIPKDVAENITEIIFNEDFKVVTINKGSVLRLDAEKLNGFNYSYIITKNVQLDSIKKAHSIILPEFNMFLGKKTNQLASSGNVITGLSILGLSEDASGYDLGIAAGIFLILALVVYYFIYIRKKEENENKKEKGEKRSPTSLTEKTVVNNEEKTLIKRCSKFLGGLANLWKNKRGSKNLFKHESEKTSCTFPKLSEIKPIEIPLEFPIEEENQPHQNNDGSFPYPNFALKEYKEAGLKNLKDSTNFSFLIGETENYIHALDFENAAKLYYVVLANLETISPGHKKTDPDTNQKLDRMHKKLCLLIKVNQLHACRKKDDFVNLRYLLNDLACLYDGLLEEARIDEKRFLQTMKYHHEVYAQAYIQKS